MEIKGLRLLSILMLSIFLIGFVAADVARVTAPAQDTEISGTYTLQADMDSISDDLNVTWATFFYGLGGTNYTIATVLNSTNETYWEYAWDTTAVRDVENIIIYVSTQNTSGGLGQYNDSNTGVDIDNGDPTAAYSISSFHDRYGASGSDTIVVGLLADTTIGIDNCTAIFTNRRTSVVDAEPHIQAVNDVCSASYVVSAISGLTAGESYDFVLRAYDNNTDYTDSVSRSFKYNDGQGYAITVGDEGVDGEGALNRVRQWFSEIPNTFRNTFTKMQMFFNGLFNRR